MAGDCAEPLALFMLSYPIFTVVPPSFTIRSHIAAHVSHFRQGVLPPTHSGFDSITGQLTRQHDALLETAARQISRSTVCRVTPQASDKTPNTSQ